MRGTGYRFGLTIRRRVYQQLEAMAIAQGRTRHAIVCEALDKFLAETVEEDALKTEKTPVASAN